MVNIKHVVLNLKLTELEEKSIDISMWNNKLNNVMYWIGIV